MARIGFIGLGVMGLPMATNLISAGHEVTGYNRSPEPVHTLGERGAREASSLGEVADGAEVVVTMLPDTPDVEGVLSGPDGLLAAVEPGTLVIDMSTISPTTSRALAEEAREAQVDLLDAPVSGGEPGAVEGTLSIMVGGDEDAFDRAHPLLEAMGTTIVHVGPAGAGQTVKAANQLLVAGIIELVAEAIVFLEAQDVDEEAALRVLAGGLAGSKVLEAKGHSMLAREFEPGFRVDLHHKDLSLLTDAARDAGLALPLASSVATLMAGLRAQGHGGLDHSALLLQVAQLSGRGAGDSPS